MLKIRSTTYPKSKDKPTWLYYYPSLTQVSNFWDNIDWLLLTDLLTKNDKKQLQKKNLKQLLPERLIKILLINLISLGLYQCTKIQKQWRIIEGAILRSQ